MKNVIKKSSSLDEQYRYYSERYDRIEKRINKKYDSDMNEAKFSKAQFKIQIEAMQREDRKTSRQLIINKLVTEQSSDLSYKQARRAKERLEEMNRDVEGWQAPNIEQIRYAGVKDAEALFQLSADLYRKLRHPDDGSNPLSAEDAKTIVGQRIWGSD